MTKRTIKKQYKNYLFKIIKKQNSKKTEKRGRKNGHSVSYYLNKILKVLFDGCTWESLDSICDNSTIRKTFYKWRDENVFIMGYQKLLDKYLQNKGHITNLFIDSTVIENQNSDEDLGYNFKYKGKKSRKITTVVTEDRITVAYVISKSSPYDVNFVEPVVNNIPIKMEPSYHKPLYIIGDKGYLSKKIKANLKKDNIILVYPNKKNAKTKTTYRYKKKLKGRYVVEASYSHLKRSYKRLKLIYDRKTKNFTTFFEMALTCEIIKYFISKRKLTLVINKLGL